MRLINLIALSLVLVSSNNLVAQHHEGENIHVGKSGPENVHGKHKVAFYAGFTHVEAAFYEHETHQESTGKWIPTIGAEYYYTLSKKFDLGVLADIELDEYYIHTDQHNELLRNNILVTAAVARYKPLHRLGIFAGPGIETEFIEGEDSEMFMVLKAGIDFEVEIAQGWELTPIFSYDFKEHYSSYSFGVSIGKRF
ncbi:MULTISPECIES: hypothetical protein [unclassified Saccharicrinis]|uniref:hypothetical protein n=1 Tax=unclassified Saccharicrinis TaxID=2646859 RepID=UPI003D3300DD